MIKNILFLLAPTFLFVFLSNCTVPKELLTIEIEAPKNEEGFQLVEILDLAEGGQYSPGSVVALRAIYTPAYEQQAIKWVADGETIAIEVSGLEDEEGVRIGESLVFTLGQRYVKITGRAVAETRVESKGLNEYVLQIIPTYEPGEFPYLLNDDYQNYNGVTEDIAYGGQIIAKANPNGDRSSHCVGLTFEVFFKAMQARNREAGLLSDDFNGLTVSDLHDFLLIWYVAKGPADTDNLAGALEQYGLGAKVVDLEKARPGDFVQLFRPGSGHAVIFKNWIRSEDGRILGLRYWSTQESTGGIGYAKEYFNDNPPGTPKGAVDRARLYIGRVSSIDGYKLASRD